MSSAASRARMNRPAIDAERLARRTKALIELATVHTRWLGVPNYFARRCSRQGWPTTTTPADLARHEIANEMTGEG